MRWQRTLKSAIIQGHNLPTFHSHLLKDLQQTTSLSKQTKKTHTQKIVSATAVRCLSLITAEFY